MTDKTLLLVDDEEDIRDILWIPLTDMGYTVFTAENGEEALNLFKVFTPPVVLTDIKMPGMDGIDLLRKIKQLSPDTEIIMLTGHGDMDLAIDSIRNDATDFLLKPINDDALEIALKRAKDRILMRQKLKKCEEELKRLMEEKAGNQTERSE